mmetsp:Transcript_2338/g.3225  ORF Transcript_2338/g.3225 Transcript_2338/m.3225 type:complete len:216 (-) Transcript_2338:712-1359(-)
MTFFQGTFIGCLLTASFFGRTPLFRFNTATFCKFFRIHFGFEFFPTPPLSILFLLSPNFHPLSTSTRTRILPILHHQILSPRLTRCQGRLIRHTTLLEKPLPIFRFTTQINLTFGIRQRLPPLRELTRRPSHIRWNNWTGTVGVRGTAKFVPYGRHVIRLKKLVGALRSRYSFGAAGHGFIVGMILLVIGNRSRSVLVFVNVRSFVRSFVCAQSS